MDRVRNWLSGNKVFFEIITPILLVFVTIFQVLIYREQTALLAIQTQLTQLELASRPRLEIQWDQAGKGARTSDVVKILNSGRRVTDLKCESCAFLETTLLLHNQLYSLVFAVDDCCNDCKSAGQGEGVIASIAKCDIFSINQIVKECQEIMKKDQPDAGQVFVDIHLYVRISYWDSLGRPYQDCYRSSLYDINHPLGKKDRPPCQYFNGQPKVMSADSLPWFYDWAWKYDRDSLKSVNVGEATGQFVFQQAKAARQTGRALRVTEATPTNLCGALIRSLRSEFIDVATSIRTK